MLLLMLLLQVFGRVVDPENFAMRVYSSLNAWQVELADARIGCLRLFSPANPTGAARNKLTCKYCQAAWHLHGKVTECIVVILTSSLLIDYCSIGCCGLLTCHLRLLHLLRLAACCQASTACC
jgi:hypothetical protein